MIPSKKCPICGAGMIMTGMTDCKYPNWTCLNHMCGHKIFVEGC